MIGLLATSSGCSGLSRLSECDGFATAVGENLEQVREVLPDAGSTAPADYRRVARRYEKAHKALLAFEASDEKLTDAAAKYRSVMARAGARARTYARALEMPERTRAQRRRRDEKLRNTQKLARSDLGRESSAIRRLDELCHPR